MQPCLAWQPLLPLECSWMGMLLRCHFALPASAQGNMSGQTIPHKR